MFFYQRNLHSERSVCKLSYLVTILTLQKGDENSLQGIQFFPSDTFDPMYFPYYGKHTHVSRNTACLLQEGGGFMASFNLPGISRGWRTRDGVSPEGAGLQCPSASGWPVRLWEDLQA